APAESRHSTPQRVLPRNLGSSLRTSSFHSSYRNRVPYKEPLVWRHMGTQNQLIEPSPPRLRGRVARSRSIGTKLTPEEERRILAAAEADGKAPSEWAREMLLGGAASTVRSEMEMHIFTELVGLQMLLMG